MDVETKEATNDVRPPRELLKTFQTFKKVFTGTTFIIITILSPPPSPRPSPPTSVSHLTGADGAAIAVQHPDLPAVLDLAVVDAVAGAVVSVGAAAVVASVQVKAHRVVGAGVPPSLAFINICRGPRK